MDATTIERLKHAQEVLGWKAEGKAFKWDCEDGRLYKALADESELVYAIMHGAKYKLTPAKTIRPFTEQEARRLVGCVLVHSSGDRNLCSFVYAEEGREDLASEKWHYHLPGDPDNLKSCWVEE